MVNLCKTGYKFGFHFMKFILDMAFYVVQLRIILCHIMYIVKYLSLCQIYPSMSSKVEF
jgi:hypothetical protein